MAVGQPDRSGQDRRSYRDIQVKSSLVRVLTDDSLRDSLSSGADVLLSTGARRLDQVELIANYAVAVDRSGNAKIGVTNIELVEQGATRAIGGAALDANLDLVATPGTCIEHAMVRFGPLPWDMPPVKFPSIQGCNEEDCIKVAHGWLRTHHNAWRANQMFAGMRSMHPESRSYFWKQPGLDRDHEKLGERTTPVYWWGGFDDERFDAIQDGIGTYWSVVKNARIDIINLTLHCKYNSADPCNTIRPLGYHTVKGHINVCNRALHDGAQYFASAQEAVTRTVAHEALHHVWLQWGHGKTYALSDTVSHWHGNSCASSPSTHQMYGETQIRHLASYKNSNGGNCNHRKKLFRRVDAYATFAYEIGEMVRSGDMWWWPAPAPPTPHPPTCVGDPGCLCSATPNAGPEIPPDGDYSIGTYCDDNNGETTCQKTKYNASETVGICVVCDDWRGPGCECDQGTPCDSGECFGDDTWNGGVGHCYEQLPPSWACAADCERLFNDPLAYCYNNHYGGARCMDSDCPKWEADSCYQQGMLCRGGQCVVECTSTADCAASGYPNYYECTSAGRCEPYWYGN